MTGGIPTIIRPDKTLEFTAPIDSPVGLWSQVRNHSVQFSWLIAGKFSLMGANAVLMLFLANHLDLSTYGLFVITISCQLLISRFLLLGVDGGMVRLSATPGLRHRSEQLVGAGLILIACSSSALLLLMMVVGPVLARFGVERWVLIWITIGTIGTALVDYGYSYRLSRQEFPYAAVAQGGTAIWRLILTTLVVLKFSGYPLAIFAAYHGASLVSGLVQSFLMARGIQRPDWGLIRQLFGYSFWLGNANVVVILSLYQGTFLLMLLNQPAATGLFGLALTLSLGFFAISTAYSEYLLVKVRSVEHLQTVWSFTRRSVIGAGVLVLASVPVVFVIAKLLPYFLGPEWRQDVPIFIYLAGSMMLLILQAPLVAACHYLFRPHLITLGWVIRVVLIGLAGVLLAPTMGAIGAAIAQLAGSFAALLILAWLVVSSLRSATEANVQT